MSGIDVTGAGGGVSVATMNAAIAAAIAAVKVPVVRRRSVTALQDTNTVLIDDTQLTFPVAAGEAWAVDLWLVNGADSATPDMKIGWNVPAATTGHWGRASLWDQPAGAGPGVGPLLTPAGIEVVPVELTAVPYGAAFHADFTFANAGVCTVQWAQNVSNANSIYMLTGSHLIAHKLAP